MKKYLKSVLHILGPGFVTGAADDDPSGIATYSIAGAQYGYALSWMSIFLIPPMVAIQEMCGRIGMITGRGLTSTIARYYPKPFVLTALILLTLANIINIGADLGAMAASMDMILPVSFFMWLIIITILTILLEVFVPYKQYAVYLKWLALSLLVYIVTAFLVTSRWSDVVISTIFPHIQWEKDFFMTMVGFLGTTISPYLFFWQAGEEVEEQIAHHHIKDFSQKPTISAPAIKHMRRDTIVGMLFSNIIAFCILVTTAGTLHPAGIFFITTPQEAAAALVPLAGRFSFLLFTVGIIGIGLQSIPILAGSLAYAYAEFIKTPEGLSKKTYQAKLFYTVIGCATLIGACINIFGINAMTALYYAAITNAIAAIPLMMLIITMADNTSIVGRYTSTRSQRYIALGTCGCMTIAALAMILW